ncbi:hypothetical protein MCHIJ_03900 [Mycolicibacterium chitae]|uniref:Predicted hydrolase N-terminal domain-containing protein n=1 Tax=Mycolicibacterium chitae TaxID=1792 RepID=A0A448IBG6_MYCCI|nr:hypothetical protein [Mycolicibacterium chitae]MCV7109265.1 hypothetical protein [Mycolicibacterium chitae]BBZ00953.1 hypothetical protein MCHIJ_03900 [Mycolicibacterium chitae]VEG49800.1 Uncharacterised protein [Mycolicibacterium chitae]
MSAPSFQYLDAASLVAAAGGDPWQADEEIQSGDPGEISGLADAFRQAGGHLKYADDQFNAAKRQFEASWDREDTVEHPINDDAEVQKVSAALGGQPAALTQIAVALQQIAAALATAQRDSAVTIRDLNADLLDIDDEIGEAMDEMPFRASELIVEAQQVAKTALDQVNSTRGAYVLELQSGEASLMETGYVPAAIDGSDGTPGDTPQEAAAEYDRSGQRAKDEETVANARRLHPHGHLHWSLDEIAADRRLDDYTSVTDPVNGAERYGDAAEQEEAARLAGSRLADFNMVHSVGPVPRDTVLGGDMRDRARGRLLLQRQLQDAQLPWSPRPMSADDATRKINAMEVQDRAAALTKLHEVLENGCGLSPEAAQAMVEGISRGVMPQEYLDAADGVSKVFGAGEGAVNKFAEVLPRGAGGSPLGAFTDADIQALGKLGQRLGTVGSVVTLGVGAYDVLVNDKSLLEVGAKAGGSAAGIWLGIKGGGLVGGAIAGPPGAFFGALLVGTAGGFVGDDVAEKALAWMKN